MSAANLPGTRSDQQTRAWVEQVMGLPVSIHVRAADTDRPDIGSAVGSCFAHLRRADRVFSPWRPDSDLMRIRREEIAVPDTHPWMSEVLDLCIAAEELTGGLFSAWYGSDGGRRIFDPTGLVKGWAVQGAAAHLEIVDLVSFCINAGGDLTVGHGRHMGGVVSPWRVGIEDPHDRSKVARVVVLGRGGLATSGSAARGAHIIDPRTGEPVERAGSATVHGPDLIWSDIWATAAYIDPGQASERMRSAGVPHELIVL